MPGDLDNQGGNAFYIGYREQMSNGNSPALPIGAKKDPFQAAKKMALNMDPTLTRHDLDFLEHLICSSGAVDKMMSPEFPKILEGLVKEISNSVGRVLTRYIRLYGS